MESIQIGIIGGSGLYNMPDLENKEEVPVRTPFGATSEPLITGVIAGVRVAFIARHGKGHRYLPTEVPYAANIFALKTLGVRHIISVSACGSLREDFAPGYVCIPDQLADFTRGERTRTFFGEGLVAHVGVADPFSPELSALLADAARAAGGTVHEGGTLVTVEGPRFSTRAESGMFRQLGFSVIGMTTAPEAFLAREAEIAYAVFSHITDYDVWHEEEEAVNAATVMETFSANLETAQRALVEAIPRIEAVRDEEWPVHNALANAFMTHRDRIPPHTIEKLRPIVGRYFAK